MTIHSEENAARHLAHRVAAASVSASQLEQRKALFFFQPKKTRTGPITVPTGYQSRSKNPPISIASPSRVLTRVFFFVAMPCRLPGNTTELRHSGHSAVAPASERK